MAKRLSDSEPSGQPYNNFFLLPSDPMVWGIWHGAMKTAHMVALLEFTRNDNQNCISIQEKCQAKAKQFCNVVFLRVIISPEYKFDQVRTDVGGVQITPTILVMFYKDANHLKRKTFKGYEAIMEGIQMGTIDKKLKEFLQERDLLVRSKKVQKQAPSRRNEATDIKGDKGLNKDLHKDEFESETGLPNTPSYNVKTAEGMQQVLLESRTIYSMSLVDFQVVSPIYIPSNMEQSSSLVLRVKCSRNGSICKDKVYAMKVVADFFTPSMDHNMTRKTYEKEYLTLSQLPPHENIIQMWAFFYDICDPSITKYLQCHEEAVRTMSLFIIMDDHPINMENYLTRLIKSEGPSPVQVLHWVLDLLDGLQFLYEHKVIHRDLKLDNLLLSRRGRLIINDFGKAIKIEEEDYKVTLETVEDKGGNEAHLAPEILASTVKELNYSKQPVWAAGVLSYELSGHNNPFVSLPYSQSIYDIENIPQLQKTFCSNQEKCQQLPANLTKVVKQMLHHKSNLRPSLIDCIKALHK